MGRTEAVVRGSHVGYIRCLTYWRRRAKRRRRAAEPDLGFREFCRRSKLPLLSAPHLERAWDAWQAGRYRRGEISQRPGYTGHPFRPR